MDIKIEIDARKLKKVLDTGKLDATLKDTIKYYNQEMARKSQRLVPVDTGHLKDSKEEEINFKDKGVYEGTVRYTADYAGYVEVGTRFMSKKPYLAPALRAVKEDFKDDILRAVKALERGSDLGH